MQKSLCFIQMNLKKVLSRFPPRWLGLLSIWADILFQLKMLPLFTSVLFPRLAHLTSALSAASYDITHVQNQSHPPRLHHDLTAAETHGSWADARVVHVLTKPDWTSAGQGERRVNACARWHRDRERAGERIRKGKMVFLLYWYRTTWKIRCSVVLSSCFFLHMRAHMKMLQQISK